MMRAEHWGLIDYALAVEKQLALVDRIASGVDADDRLVVCTHPPMISLGRGADPADAAGWTGPVFESSRGGKVTYHGPSQTIFYPVVDLRRARRSVPARDVHAYLRELTEGTAEALVSVGLVGACARFGDGVTGVWVGDQKVASVGIAVRKWVTYHGVAVNVSDDPQAFQGIRPCGFSAGVMRSIGFPVPNLGTRMLEVLARRFEEL